MTQYWFRPHTHGYGATPANWKGWAAIGLFVATLGALSLSLMAYPAEMPAGAVAWQLTSWAMLVAVLTFAFLKFYRDRTDGAWAWRWGGRRNGEMKRIELGAPGRERKRSEAPGGG